MNLPWYDAYWLYSYQKALKHLAAEYPEKLDKFKAAIAPFKTRLDFSPQEVPAVLSAQKLTEARRIVANLKPTQIEMHEALKFGRFVVHDHEYFNDLQRAFIPLVSELAGEAVEPSYNFLSLYAKKGVCGLHMDAPRAKWTLDVCLEQTVDWPIYFGPVREWPENVAEFKPGWEDQVKAKTNFTSHTLRPGNAVLFSGSSQWHYRKPMPQSGVDDFCNLIFFHYIPKGSRPLCEPEYWPEYFGVSDLPFARGFTA